MLLAVMGTAATACRFWVMLLLLAKCCKSACELEDDHEPIAQGAVHTAREVLAHDGIRGLYKGFGTVVLGMFPARMASLPRG